MNISTNLSLSWCLILIRALIIMCSPDSISNRTNCVRYCVSNPRRPHMKYMEEIGSTSKNATIALNFCCSDNSSGFLPFISLRFNDDVRPCRIGSKTMKIGTVYINILVDCIVSLLPPLLCRFWLFNGGVPLPQGGVSR